MSMSRRCDVVLCKDGKWWMALGDFEHAESDDDCTFYGPFKSEDEALDELDYHSNPGAFRVRRAGDAEPPDPKKVRVQKPSKLGGSYGGLGVYRF